MYFMKEIKIMHKSTFLGREIDVWGTAEEPLFRASDVAEWIEHSDVNIMLKMVDEEEKLTQTILGSGQRRNVWMLTEDGLYEVLMQSRKPIAKQFKKGVKEILKSIRKTGGYIATTESDSDEDIMARAYVIAQQTLARREQRIKELEANKRQQEITIEQKDAQISVQTQQIKAAAPKVEYCDNTLASVDCITATQVAEDLGISAKAFNQKLKEHGIIYRQSGMWHLRMPYKGCNLAQTRTFPYPKSDGTFGTTLSLVWNQRGKRFILALFKHNFNVKSALAEISDKQRDAITTK